MSQTLNRIQLLRKLWVHLTPKETYGLTSPDKIQRSGQTLGDIRRQELSHLINIERQLHEVRRGHSTLDATGKLTESDEIRDIQQVKFSSIIESAEPQQVQKEGLPDLLKMLENASEVSKFDALERILRLQKLYLLAERIILAMDIIDIDKSALDRRWFNRWKLNACEISNGGLQQLWARILIRELKNPGTTSLRALEQLSSFSHEDAENLNKVASWACGDFIYRSALQALPDHFETELFEQLEEQGIVRGVFGKVLSKTLRSEQDQDFSHKIPMAGKILTIRSTQPRSELHVPAYMLTSVGRELISLVSPEIDHAYLKLVAQDLQARGMSVQIQDSTEVHEKRHSL